MRPALCPAFFLAQPIMWEELPVAGQDRARGWGGGGTDFSDGKESSLCSQKLSKHQPERDGSRLSARIQSKQLGRLTLTPTLLFCSSAFHFD